MYEKGLEQHLVGWKRVDSVHYLLLTRLSAQHPRLVQWEIAIAKGVGFGRNQLLQGSLALICG